MDKDFDSLLEDGLLDVPDDFTQMVMQRIHRAPLPLARLSLSEKLQNLALIAGGVLGFSQLAAFMFGVWAATAAG
ncbi:MAG TPA: hypothetical protein VIF82_15810 [Burkholderiaceae bacterium]